MVSAFFRQRPVLAQLLLALVLAFVTRAWQFGNPVIQLDEQFYLLTGDRLLHGAVPYVDIWDRKPIGIFLIYAAIRLLGGEGIYQYQIVATLFAGTTAFLIAWMALRFTDARGAALSGVAYLVWLLIFDGSGGQAPVFYNALMAGAAAATLAATDPQAGVRPLFARGTLAILLVGLALQIRYAALLEGIFFGLALLWRARSLRFSWSAIALAASLWAWLAILPSAAVLGYYIWIGQDQEFVYANLLSIFDRGTWPVETLGVRLGTLVGLSSPLLLCAWAEWRMGTQSERPSAAHARRFALLWLGTAFVGLLASGTFLVHYFLPVLVPLTLVCARLLGDPSAGLALITKEGARRIPLAALLTICAIALVALTIPKRLERRGDGTGVREVAAVVRHSLNGCLFVFDGEPILYELTGACLATTRALPSELNEAIEARSMGMDPITETMRILDARPDVIIGSDRPDDGFNPLTLALVNRALVTDYHSIYRIAIGGRERIVYKRNSPPLAANRKRPRQPNYRGHSIEVGSTSCRPETL